MGLMLFLNNTRNISLPVKLLPVPGGLEQRVAMSQAYPIKHQTDLPLNQSNLAGKSVHDRLSLRGVQAAVLRKQLPSLRD